MKRKQIIAICLTVAILAGVVTAALAFGRGDTQQGQGGNDGGKGGSLEAVISEYIEKIMSRNQIVSDGTRYPVKVIDSAPVAKELPQNETLPAVGDVETLLKLLKDRGALYDASKQTYDGFFASGWGGAVIEDGIVYEDGADASMNAAPPIAPGAAPDLKTQYTTSAEADSGTSGGASGGHSETNEQVAGVNEGDIVKTDGRYIYSLSSSDGKLRIIQADGAALKVVSTITLGSNWPSEFYLVGDDRLVIVGSEYVSIQPLPATAEGDSPSTRAAATPDYYGWYSNNFTTLHIYDITDRAAPRESRTVSMDGWNVSTRVIGDIVYMVTNKHVWNVPYDNADSIRIMPYVCDTAVGREYEPLSLDSIYYIPDTTDCSYLMIGAVDVYGSDEIKPYAYLGAGSNLYMSQNAIYGTKWRWEDNARTSSGNGAAASRFPLGNQVTDILRFAIERTDIRYTGTGTVTGSPINQYSMDEHDGYFRIATTDFTGTGTFVTVLNAAGMNTVGRTEPLAPGENMQSMRFMGDMGYVVTFQNMDPLFTIDLSDPYNPKMLGELKIPGFSQYLHPVGDGLLLGIGRDTQELYTRDANGVESVIGFKDVGMKASLFDVSDPYDPKEVVAIPLGEGWAEVGVNPRALMCDRARGIYGFTVETWNQKDGSRINAILLTVADGSLSIGATINTADTSFYSVYGSRLCFIGNTLYIAHGNGVLIYDYSSYAKLGSIIF